LKGDRPPHLLAKHEPPRSLRQIAVNRLETTLRQNSEMTGTSDAPECLQTMDTDGETRELRALCEQFKQTMKQQIDAPEFEKDAKVRLGQMIGRAALGSSEYGYPSRR
jgi:hypothetical protein